MYGSMLDVSDFVIVPPNVQSIRETIDTSYSLKNKVVICIENLDKGVVGASYTLLKFLEEPSDKVYIVVTCRNINQIPHTILSRSTSVSLTTPISSDLEAYGSDKHKDRYDIVRHHPIWRCVTTFKDVDVVCKMTDTQLDYFLQLSKVNFSDSISNLMWKLGHYDDNSECPTDLVIKYILSLTHNVHVHRCGIDCLNDLAQGRVAYHAVLAKFCMDMKYTE